MLKVSSLAMEGLNAAEVICRLAMCDVGDHTSQTLPEWDQGCRNSALLGWRGGSNNRASSELIGHGHKTATSQHSSSSHHEPKKLSHEQTLGQASGRTSRQTSGQRGLTSGTCANILNEQGPGHLEQGSSNSSYSGVSSSCTLDGCRVGSNGLVLSGTFGDSTPASYPEVKGHHRLNYAQVFSSSQETSRFILGKICGRYLYLYLYSVCMYVCMYVFM
jgi:hypothetical protein